MTIPTRDRGRCGGNRATPKALQSWRHRTVQRAQAAIVRAALWGFVPLTVAHRIVRWIGGGDD